MCLSHGIVERSPCIDSCVHIPEPFTSNVLEIVCIHVRNTGGHFSAGYQAIQVGGLSGQSLGGFHGAVSFQQLDPVSISGSEEFGLVDLHTM